MPKNEQDAGIDPNLVMFPASKNYAPKEDILDDPLEELLNEFSELIDEQEALDSSLDSEAWQSLSFDEGTQEYWDYLLENLELIREMKRRINYYMEEIELYLPDHD